MRFRLLITLLLGGGFGALLVIWAVEQRLGQAALAVGVHPDVMAALDAGLADQRQLAALDPAQREVYRAHFERLEQLRGRLHVLDHSRETIVRRAQQTLVVLVGALLVVSGSIWWWGARRTEQRLERLREHLAALAAGATDLTTGEHGRDTLGRVARLVEETSRVVARERQRRLAFEHLAQWQEAARRHAHEIRTPLTAAGLELDRLRQVAEGTPEAARGELCRLADSLAEELTRLRRFTREFAGFARLRAPQPVPRDLDALLAELAATFAGAWPDFTLRYQGPTERPLEALVDAELLRQLVINLADNAARAVAPRTGSLTIRLERSRGQAVVTLVDDGPGLPASIRARLFTPYTTTRASGEGMGLGLSIARKIALDHGGDLELVTTGPAGTIFRLALPLAGTDDPAHPDPAAPVSVA